MRGAFEFARYFIKNGIDNPRNTIDGNMKLQKFLVLSYAYYLAKYNKKLFSDCPIYAYKNGCVCETVRLKYRNNCNELIEESKRFTPDFTADEKDTVEFIESKFSGFNAKELSEFNHVFDFWKNTFESSKVCGIPIKSKSIVKDEDILKEKEKILKELNDANNLKCIKINNINFLYNPNEIKITEALLEQLKNFKPIEDEDTYTIYFDANAGLVIY